MSFSLIRPFVRSLSTSATSMTVASVPYPAVLPPMGYGYNALEPAISGQIMETHHTKHHQAYVTNLNNALVQMAESEKNGDISKSIQLQGAIKFNGGGHINHSIFWTNLAPKSQGGGELPDSKSSVTQLITKEFGSFENLKSQLNGACLGIQGSGWGWLAYNKNKDKIELLTRANQDPVVEMGLVPLLGVDVWEHAYYYLYGPQRAKYLEALWGIINWRNVEERLNKAKLK